MQMRADIISGRLAPGQRLKLDRLRDSYPASASTLREILCRLAAEGFVVAEGQRGFEVAPISADGLRDVAGVRLLLEQHAMERSFEAGDLEWEAQVLAAHHKLASVERTLPTGATRPDHGKRYDFEFHHALVSACRSRTLLELFSNVYDRYMRYLCVAMAFRGDVAVREHALLLDCALRRDIGMARRTLASHLEGGVDAAISAGLPK